MYPKYKKIHFVGIGGIGMSGIAELLLNLGYEITGSDIADSEVTRRLKGLGCRISIGHEASQIESAEVVVISSAIPPDNPELLAAKADPHMMVIKRAEMLAELMRLKYGIAVAGMHGKTTTTTMVAHVLVAGGLDPTVIIGGKVEAWGTTALLGGGDFLVAEADESDGSFLLLTPTINVVTNIDREHLDYYAGLNEIRDVFLRFMHKVPFYGVDILCLDDPNIQSLIPLIDKRMITYGLSPQADLRAEGIRTEGRNSVYRAFYQNEELGEVMITVPGLHNVLNSLAAVAVGVELGVGFDAIRDGLATMGDIGRRFQVLGEARGVTVIDDYGHHPTEIKAVLATLSSMYPGRRKVVLFQPHRYTRTNALMDDFTTAFYGCHRLLVMEIYAASEQPIEGVTGRRLTGEIIRHGHQETTFVGEGDDALEAVLREVREGDVLLTLGAGNVWQMGKRILERLE